MVDVVHGFVALNPPERFGSHVLLAQLGAGGMGTVYLAARPSELGDGHVVALKCLELPHDDPRARSSFVDEVRIVSRLSHPCVARMLDAGQSESRAWIAIELVLGETLGTAISRVPTAARPLFAARALAHACEGLHAAIADHLVALSAIEAVRTDRHDTLRGASPQLLCVLARRTIDLLVERQQMSQGVARIVMATEGTQRDGEIVKRGAGLAELVRTLKVLERVEPLLRARSLEPSHKGVSGHVRT